MPKSPIFDVRSLQYDTYYSSTSPAQTNLSRFHAHPQWKHIADIPEHIARLHVRLTSSAKPHLVKIRDFPEGSIFAAATPFAKTYIYQWGITQHDIFVSAVNHYCSALNGKEYTFDASGELHYSKVTKVIWSDVEVVSQKQALQQYDLLPLAEPAIFINSKGRRTIGYRKTDLTPKASENQLKFRITSPQNYATDALDRLLQWERAGKTITRISDISNNSEILRKVLLATSDLVKPSNYQDFTGTGTYTCKNLSEHIRSNEFWERFFQFHPDLMGLFGALTDEKLREDVFSVYAFKLLTANTAT